MGGLDAVYTAVDGTVAAVSPRPRGAWLTASRVLSRMALYRCHDLRRCGGCGALLLQQQG
jgi:hypothetical protein